MRGVRRAAGRRRFLGGAAASVVAAWVPRSLLSAAAAAAGETAVGTVPFVGEGPFPLEETVGAGLGRRRALDLSTLTPATGAIAQDRFFIRTGCPDPMPSTRGWKVRMRGLVESPLDIDVETLRGEAADLGPHLLECAGNSRAAHYGFLSVARWTGVPLARVLARVRPRPGATRVLVSGFDRHSVLDPGSVPGASWIFGLEEARAAGAFLATGMNGGPLAPDHGHPLRLVVPGWYGCAAIKWVDEIALVDDGAPATDQMREYAGRTHQDPGGGGEASMGAGRRPEGPPLAKDFRPATIDPAAVPVRVEALGGAGAGASYRIMGILWGPPVPTSALRVRLDPEAPVSAVEDGGRSAGGWRFWSCTFRPRAPGRHRIEVSITGGGRTRRQDAGYYTREIDVPRV